MQKEPTVTAIITTYNRQQYVTEAITSLLAQTRPPDEIIVVDDASTDDTPARLASFAERVTVWRNPANRGKPATLNAVIPEARGSYVWLFDDDDVALPDALARHLDCLSAYPDADFTYSGAFHVEAGRDIHDRAFWRPLPTPAVPPEAFLMQTMLAMYTLMQGMLLPRDGLIEIGLFDPDLDRCEDLDMLLRLGVGHRGRGLAEPTYVYREHGGTRGAAGKRHSADERVRVMVDYRRIIFRRLRERLPLAVYLNHQPNDAPVAETRHAEDWQHPAALLYRAGVMYRQGLEDEGLNDLASAMACPGCCDMPLHIIDGALGRMLDPEPWIYDRPVRRARRLISLLRRYGYSSWAPILARGAYWAGCRAMTTGAYRTAAEAGLMVALLEKNNLAKRLRWPIKIRNRRDRSGV